jgi:hypothetical protein
MDLIKYNIPRIKLGACVGVPSFVKFALDIELKKCIHSSHDPDFEKNLSDWSSLYPSVWSNTMVAPHGKIPHTYHTSTFINLVIYGTMSLYMLGVDHLEIYVTVLKEFVPRCYNIWDLVENIIKSIHRVKKPNYMSIMKQLKIEQKKILRDDPRKATPEDFGISTKKHGYKKRF